MALFKFTDKILKGEPIDVFNYGNHRRDFTYIDDIVEGVVRVMGKTPEGNPDWSGDNPDPASSKAPWKVYNIGNNQPVELMRYIEVIEDCLGKKAEKNMLPLQPGDVPDTYADVDALVEDVGYKPNDHHRRRNQELHRLVPRVLWGVRHQPAADHPVFTLWTVNCPFNGTIDIRLKDTMPRMPDMVPISDLRQGAAALLQKLRKSRNPVVVTQRGRAAAVLLSIEEYERRENDLEVLSLLVRGEQEIAAGIGYDLDEVLADVDGILEGV